VSVGGLWLRTRQKARGAVGRYAPAWVRDRYPTPKIDVRGVVFEGGKVLLVREASDGRWSLPGGWADVGEPLSTAVTREIHEESGYPTRATKVLAILNLNRRSGRVNVYKMFVQCELTEAVGRISGAETTEAAWFDEDALPPLSESRGTSEQLRLMFEHARNTSRPTDFD
jgi:ADP-ribose pyrophosphatase YjhB (NUDIX family)